MIAEDNKALLNSIMKLLSEEYVIDYSLKGDEALYLAEQNIYDVIILDVMLPEMDGFEVLQKLRDQNIETPVLFLTARDSLEDRVRGLNLGGDDYLVKPFQNQELQARLQAILRRSAKLSMDHKLTYKGIVINSKKKQILINDEVIHATVKQYELLEYLINNREQILTREQIYDRIWGFDSDTTIGIVEVYIHKIRKILQAFHYDKDIKTIRGIGYILSEE